MKKILSIVFFALFGVLVCLQAKEIKIGVVLPLSGYLSNEGEDARSAILVYKNTHPETTNNTRLIFEDDQSAPSGAAKAASKLINIDHVDALISFYGYGAHAVSAIAYSKKTLHFGITLDKDFLKPPYSFALWPSAEGHGKLMGDVLAGLGYKKVGLVTARSQGSIKFMEATKLILKEKGMEYFEINILTDERDLRPVILKLEEQKCDVWAICLYTPQPNIFLRQCRQWKTKSPVTAIMCFDDLENKHLADGLWYVRSLLPAKTFVDSFEAKTKHEPHPAAIFSHDVMKLLSEAFAASRGDAVAAGKYLENLKSADGEGGHYVGDGSGFFDSPAILTLMENGHPRQTTLEEIKSLQKK